MTFPVTVMVTGATGQVGVDLVDTLMARHVPGADSTWQPDGQPIRDGEFAVVAFSKVELDVTSESALRRVIDEIRPDVLVNLAAYTKVDAAESNERACRQLNCNAVATMSQLSAASGAHFVTVSTDYVFDGEKGAPYVENDVTNPLNVYGLTKRDGELHCSPHDTVVRTSWVMGVRAQNVAHLVATRVRAGETLRFVTDQIGTPTMSADLARAMVTLIRHRLGGTWHLANEAPASWFDVASEVALVTTASSQLIHPITTNELDPLPAARRPARSDLLTAKWTGAGYAPWPNWRPALSRLLSDC